MRFSFQGSVQLPTAPTSDFLLRIGPKHVCAIAQKYPGGADIETVIIHDRHCDNVDNAVECLILSWTSQRGQCSALFRLKPVFLH